MSLDAARGRLAGFFKRLGAQYVLDTGIADEVAARSCASEFVARVKAGSEVPIITSHCPGWICYAEKTQEREMLNLIADGKTSLQIQGALVKSLFAANVWEHRVRWTIHSSPLFGLHNPFAARNRNETCSDSTAPAPPPTAPADAEPESDPEPSAKDLFDAGALKSDGRRWRLEISKTYEMFVRPENSCVCVQSARSSNAFARSIFHIYVAPCFDKKLESLRPEANFHSTDDTSPMPEVDLVLASLEVDRLIREVGVEFADLPVGTVDDLFVSRSLRPPQELKGCRLDANGPVAVPAPLHGESGGFAARSFALAAAELCGGAGAPMTFSRFGNKDFSESTLSGGGRTFKFWKAYGFRNVQNVLRRIKPPGDDGASAPPCNPAHFVELMACPGGCINGGGQRLEDEVIEERPDLLEGMHSRLSARPEDRSAPPDGFVVSVEGETLRVPDEESGRIVDFCRGYLESMRHPLKMSYNCLSDGARSLPTSLKW